MNPDQTASMFGYTIEYPLLTVHGKDGPAAVLDLHEVRQVNAPERLVMLAPNSREEVRRSGLKIYGASTDRIMVLFESSDEAMLGMVDIVHHWSKALKEKYREQP